MMTLKAEKRDPQVKAKKLRREGFVTGVLYGKEMKENIALKFEEKEALRRRKEQEAFEKAERKRLAQGKLTMFERFEQLSFEELEQLLIAAKTREERSFYRSLLNLKLQIEQEKVIGEVLL